MAASGVKSYLMVAEAATEIVSQKLEILLSDPVCVGCLLMETRVKGTKAKLDVIQELFSTQYRVLSETTEWWRRLLQAMYYAEEFIDKFHLREVREMHKALYTATRPLATLVSKYMLWRDLSYLVNDLDKLCQDKVLTGKGAEGKGKTEPSSSSSHASVPLQGKKWARLTSFWYRQAPTNFSCRMAEKRKLMNLIKRKSVEIEAISICGEQGTGKTFLARWVYSQAKYMGYEWRAWVHVSASMDKREFLFEILKQVEQLPREMKDMDINEIKDNLWRKLVEAKRFLIVLDDVHPSNEPLLRELVTCIPLISHGQIIYTTRDYMIASYMNTCEEPIVLKNLSNDESQRMLTWKLHRAPGGQRLSDEEKNILNRCHGLPLCISLLGGFLSNAGEHERAELVEELPMKALLDILQLSCYKLPVHLKPCFIYMALFPVAFPIPIRRLVKLWLAEGLLDSHYYGIERERTRPPENVGKTFVLELADRNVIDVVSWRADGSPKACQMLTSLYDMIRPIAMSTGFIHTLAAILNPTGQQKQLPAQLLERTKVRWLAEQTNIVTDSRGDSFPDLHLGHVRSFLSFYMRRGILTKDIGTFLGKMTSKSNYSLLRVLDLEGVYKPSLQGVLHKLVLLRYLGLRCTVLDSLPSAVADLHYLETLDIKHTNITSLPSSFWKARNLRHLHLNWFYINLKTILKACSNNVMALTKLQTLSGLVIGEVKENSMTGHMESLTTLKLFLHQSDRDTLGAAGKVVADWISFRLTNLQSLTFGVTKKAKPKKEATKVAKPTEETKPVKEATEKAERAEGAKPTTSQIGPLPELSLAEHRDLLELYLVGQLKKPIWTQLLPDSLRVLTLSGSKVETDLMPELGCHLSNLRTFRLLAESFLGTQLSFAEDGFPNLMILKIWKLPGLEEVLIKQGAMPHLKELEFRHLKRLKAVQGFNLCTELETICVISQSRALVNQLDNAKGEKTNLYVEEETKSPKSTYDYKDDSSDGDGDGDGDSD